MSQISEQELDALLRGLKDVSEETREGILSQVRGVNRAGQSGQYVFRSAPEPTEIKVELPDMQPIVNQIVEAVVGRVNDLINANNATLSQQVTESLNDIAERVEGVETSTEQLQTQVAPVIEEHQNRQVDQPAGRQGGNLFIPRFRRQASANSEGEAKKPVSANHEARAESIFKGFR